MKLNPAKLTKKKAASTGAAFSLTPKQSMFVKEYLIDLNATQAAIRAGYSEKTAGQIGEQNLKKLEIAKAIQDEMDKRGEKIDITSENVLESIVRIRGKAEKAERYGDALKANELLGKHLMLWKESGSKENPLNVIHKVERTIIRPDGNS